MIKLSKSEQKNGAGTFLAKKILGKAGEICSESFGKIVRVTKSDSTVYSLLTAYLTIPNDEPSLFKELPTN